MSNDMFDQINDDDDYGIASAFGVPSDVADEHVAAPSEDDIFCEDGTDGNAGGYKVHVGAGRFHVTDEGPLVEAVIAVVAEMGMVFELPALDPDPDVSPSEVRWYREFSSDKGIIATLSVALDCDTGLYKMAVSNEETRDVYAVSGINTAADVSWLLADVFRYSQFH